jgi:predicted GNAT family N-acyltransferase
MLDIIVYAQQQGRAFLHLSSQVHAKSFYQQLGFSVQGDEYDECGIPHIEMRMPLRE